MTLNITVAARWLMAQSSDFRLTSSGDVVSDASQKQVVLQYPGWSGLVCYTGIARYGPHDTALWLEQVLTHAAGRRSPDQVVKRLIEQGTLWLQNIPAKDRRHTFTMIAYENSKPSVYVISNFERPNGPQLSTPTDALFYTRIRPQAPRCIVTGWSSAVSDEQKELLKDVLAHVPSPKRLRESVAQTSRESSTKAKGTVSEACVVAHLCPDGSGEAQVFGNLHQEYLPTMITHGMNVALHVPAALTDAGAVGPHRLVGVTWTSNPTKPSVMCGAYRAITNETGTGWQSASDPI